MDLRPIPALVAYLHGLAPAFFAERMRGAPPEDIARLESLVGFRLSDNHREFLLSMGATPAGALNPFLNDRDYSVARLIEEYEAMTSSQDIWPDRVVLFSSSEILGSTIFLRQGEDLAQDPEIGDLSYEPRQAPAGEPTLEGPAGAHGWEGRFLVHEERRLMSWLRWFAFTFRESQLEHHVWFNPPFVAAEQRWAGDAARGRAIFGELGFPTVFELESDTWCMDRGDVAVTSNADGSGSLAGDDANELKKIAAVLDDHLTLRFRPVAEDDRLRAPRR
ncbi:MAG: hypothetical protein AB1Z98_31895 [Nannocystaceae bacterium]